MTKQDPYSIFRHDVWGKDYDEWLSDRGLDDVIQYLAGEDGKHGVCGGDLWEKHFSWVISNTSEAMELLDSYAESGMTPREFFCHYEDCMEEQYAELMGADPAYCEPYALQRKTAKTVCNILERSAKGYERCYAAEDDVAIKRFANTLFRRFNRAVRKLPGQSFGELANFQRYTVTIEDGKLIDIRKA